LNQRFNRWHGTSWGRGGGHGFDADSRDATARETVSREVAASCLAENLETYGTSGPAALAWRWALTGQGPTPVSLRGWHEGRPTAKRCWMRAGGRKHRSFVPGGARDRCCGKQPQHCCQHVAHAEWCRSRRERPLERMIWVLRAARLARLPAAPIRQLVLSIEATSVSSP
jgi:hypothetical protein